MFLLSVVRGREKGESEFPRLLQCRFPGPGDGVSDYTLWLF